jgi:hypothetical protein
MPVEYRRKQFNENCSMKKKVLVISLKYSVEENSGEEIMKILADNGQFEAKLAVCTGSLERHSLLGQIDPYGGYDWVFIIWEWAFDADGVEMFVRALHRKLPSLRMAALSNDPRCREILRQAGCCADLDTNTISPFSNTISEI